MPVLITLHIISVHSIVCSECLNMLVVEMVESVEVLRYMLIESTLFLKPFPH